MVASASPMQSQSDDNIFSYLMNILSDSDFDRLYASEWACLAVFRAMGGDVTQQYMLRLLTCDRITDVGLFSSLTSNLVLHRAALQTLLALRIIAPASSSATSSSSSSSSTVAIASALEQPASAPGSSNQTATTYAEQQSRTIRTARINEAFQSGLRRALFPAQNSPIINDASRIARKPDKHRPSSDDLDRFAQRCWDRVLHFLVGSETEADSPLSKGVKDLLLTSNLTQRDEHGAIQITNEGFQFLLQDTPAQVWRLLREYLRTAGDRHMNHNEMLQFLFELTFYNVGMDYPLDTLTPTQRVMVQDLGEFGLIFQRKQSSRRFYSTWLAQCTTNSSLPQHQNQQNLSNWSSSSGAREGFIILETNYRVYAYTNSPIKIALLSLFVHLQYLTPNLIVGTITRESVRAAIASGISADQILRYLYLNAHPQMRKRTPVLPETIVEQIRLWENERNRISTDKAYLYDKFPTKDAFLSTVNFAKSIGVFLWSNEQRQTLVARTEGHDEIRNFIKKFTK